jgi:uncharacterized membrane protein
MSNGSMNLTVQRGDKSVWDAPGLASTLSNYDQERWMAAAWGSALAVLGARRGGFGGGLLAMIGSTLAVRAAMGRRDLHSARHWLDRAMQDRGWRPVDVVSETSEDSFPASDAPSWTADSGATISR